MTAVHAAPPAVHHHQPVAAIVRSVDDLGWPHAPQRSEAQSVARLMLHSYVGRYRRGSVSCAFRVPFGRGYCRVVRGSRSFRVNWRFFEDGSGTSWVNLGEGGE